MNVKPAELPRSRSARGWLWAVPLVVLVAVPDWRSTSVAMPTPVVEPDDASSAASTPATDQPSPQAEPLPPLGPQLESLLSDTVPVFSQTNPVTIERLIRQHLAQGLPAAAEATLKELGQKIPRARQSWYLAAIAQQRGDDTTALRLVSGIDRRDPAVADLPIREHERLLEFVTRRSTSWTKRNPYGVNFLDTDGRWPLGRPGTTTPPVDQASLRAAMIAMTRLIAVVPNRGELWSLWGLLANAVGESRLAAEGFRRAAALNVTSADQRDWLRQIESAEAALRASAVAQLPSPDRDATPASNEWRTTFSSQRVKFVWGIGLLVVAGLITLQLRQWWHWLRGKPQQSRDVGSTETVSASVANRTS